MRRQGHAVAGAAAALVSVLLVSGCTPFPGGWFGGDPVIPPPNSEFTEFSAQEPAWAPCGDGAECADVYAPLDWADPSGERITLRLAKHAATGGDPIGTLFINTGGPGSATASDVRQYVDGLVSASVRERFDVIGWDPRGVGDSTAVTCLDDAGLDDFLYGTGDPQADGADLPYGSDAWIEAGIESTAEFGAACAAQTGALLGHVDTGSTVRDLDMLRAIVGDAKLHYLGYSYGTRIGALYADRFPERVGRIVLDGAMDPAADLAEIARAQGEGIEGALEAYVADCLTRNGCPLNGTVAEGMRQIDELLAAVEAEPIRAEDGRMLYDSTLFTALIAPLYVEGRWPEIDELITDVRAGRAGVAFRLADAYNDRVGGSYRSNLMEAFIAINCVDTPRPDPLDFDVMRAQAAESERRAPVSGRYQSFGDLSCAGWPVPAVDVIGPVTAEGADPILVVGTTGDPATPYRWAVSLAEQLSSGVLLTFEGEGHTAYGSSDCVDHAINDYLITGAVPTGSPVCTS